MNRFAAAVRFARTGVAAAIEAKLDTLTATLENNLKQALAIASNYQQTVVNHYEQKITNRNGEWISRRRRSHPRRCVGGQIVSNTYNTYFTVALTL